MASTTNTEGETASEAFAKIAIRAGWKYNEFLLEEISEVLDACTLPQVDEIGRKLLRNCRFTPKIAEIVKAKAEAIPEHTGIGEYGKKQPWDLREEQIYATVDKYLIDLTSSEIMQEAIRDNWQKELARFAQSTASTMANMIHGFQPVGKKYANWGWDSMAVNLIYREEYLKLLRSNYHYIRQNGIDVMRAMPAGQIPKWKANVDIDKEFIVG